MKIYSSYKVKLHHHRREFVDTTVLYRRAVDFFIRVCMDRWSDISAIPFSNARMMYVEALCHKTNARPHVPYDFDTGFYKFPSYLRRSAIAEAIGAVSSYKSHLALWEKLPPSERGRKPTLPKSDACPAMYRNNCYIRIDNYTAKLKVFTRNTWDWVTVTLRKSDADYILHHCADRKECVPVLMKRGKQWYLAFSFEENVSLSKKPVSEQTALCVDLGINSAAVCSVMRSDGTVIARRFLHLAKENDHLMRRTGKIKAAQCHGSKCCRRLWAFADNVNKDITSKTAQFIINTAAEYNVDVIVFEYLDTGGKKRGSNRQRLHLWKSRGVQSIVTDKAHRLGMRISRVNAYGTSRLAFDGSGRVKRGKESVRTGGQYGICEFANGKLYNCDLNASYNIGARYFIREILKSLPVTERQCMEAKVPACTKRSTCTLSTLISLGAVLHAVA